MARKKRSKSGKPSMLSLVKQILAETPAATAPEVVAIAQNKFGVTIPGKTASVYRYSILNPKKSKKRMTKTKLDATLAPVSPSRPASSTEGFDELFRAAEKLGWKRLKDVVQKITQAPH